MKKICEICNNEFDTLITIKGIKHNICNRKMCLNCSPFKAGNRMSAANYRLKKESEGLYFCAKCKKMNPIDEFYLKADGKRNHSYCKVCQNNNVLDRQRLFKKKAIEYKGGKCCLCEYNICEGALEFHHLDPSIKEFGLAAGKLRTFEKSKKELDKCVLVCANCHREIHAGVKNIVLP